MLIATTERVTYQKFVGRDWREGVEGAEREKTQLPGSSSFLHSVVCILGSATKIRGQKRLRLLYNFVTYRFVIVNQRLAQPPSWRTTPCWLSATANAVYSICSYHPYLKAFNERRRRVLSSSASCSKRPGIKSRPGNQFSWFTVVPSGKYPACTLN
jgi:hypothetical protein